MLNRSVDQSLFGDKNKSHTNYKQQIRSIQPPTQQTFHSLDPALLNRKQTELRILTDQLADKQRRDRIVKRIDKKL